MNNLPFQHALDQWLENIIVNLFLRALLIKNPIKGELFLCPFIFGNLV